MLRWFYSAQVQQSLIVITSHTVRDGPIVTDCTLSPVLHVRLYEDLAIKGNSSEHVTM